MKFRNMGASCFVNAGLQAVFALPGFESLRETTATERALIETRHLANETSSAVIPQPMLDLYYQRRQEDCGEFLMELLSDCPTVHSKLRGQEKAFLACTACGYRRALPTEHFLSMQVALVDEDRLLQSVQAAVNTYVEQQPLQEDVLHWECETNACLASGTARQAPRRLTTVEEWPENLVVTLKRWDGLHGLLSHKVHVDPELRVEQGNIVYRLRSVVSHIGETAASGHYVAYRPRESDFLRFDDSTVSTTRQNPGAETAAAGEKVYIVCYTRVAEVPVIPAVPAKRDAIHLDDSDESEDSDVIVASIKKNLRQFRQLFDRRTRNHSPGSAN